MKSQAKDGSLVERSAARAWRWIERFALTPANGAPLAALRIGIAAVLLFQAARIAPALYELYGRAGILQGELRDAIDLHYPFRIDRLIVLLTPLGLGEGPIIAGTGLLYVMSLIALLLGWRTRLAAAVAWGTHWLMMATVDSMLYGVDWFANMSLFYLIWMPSAMCLSLDRRYGRASAEPTSFARISLRVLQLNLCICYLSSGIEKARIPHWWNGNTIWRTLVLPEWSQVDFTWLARYPWMAVAIGWTVLLIEIGYCVFIWPRKTRKIWLTLTVGMHLGIALFMGLHSFAFIMMALNISAFAVSPEPTGSRATAPSGSQLAVTRP